MFPIDAIRGRFPALRDTDTVFLDNAAGAQLPDPVVVRTVEAMTEMQVNKGAAYAASVRVTEAKERVRAHTAAFLGADPDEVAFGANATTLVTLLAGALAPEIRRGDVVVVSGLDHHANIDPWRRLEAFGAELRRWAPRGPEAQLELDDLRELLASGRPRLVAFTAASNALGSYTPVAEACALVRQAGALAMVDAVHYAPHRLPDVADFGCDLLVFSPYKVVGPHLGALWLGPRARERLAGHPLAFFGAEGPLPWEPGTQNHEGILGWGGVFDYLDEVAGWLTPDDAAPARSADTPPRERWLRAYRAFEAHERALLERLLDGLDELGFPRYGLPGAEGRTATVAFNHPTWDAAATARFLAARDVAVAAGHYYAFDLMMATLGLRERGGAVRASALHYTSFEDVERLLAALRDARDADAPPEPSAAGSAA